MTVKTTTWWNTMGSDTSGGWEKYCMAVEHMCIATMFSKEVYKSGKFSLKFLLLAREFWLSGYWITGSLHRN
jgi:hypothetical protein